MKPFCSLFALLFILNTGLSADTRKVFLGNIDLAGTVPENIPVLGEFLTIENPEQPIHSKDDLSDYE